MVWLFAIIVVVVLGAVAIVAAGRGGELSPAYDDRPDVLLPSGRSLTAADLGQTRFTVSWRGYRPHEVDALLERLARELAESSASAEPVAPAVTEAAAQADTPDSPVEPDAH